MLRAFIWRIENPLKPSSLLTAEISPCTAPGAIADSVLFPISPDSFGGRLQTPMRCRSATPLRRPKCPPQSPQTPPAKTPSPYTAPVHTPHSRVPPPLHQSHCHSRN